MGQRVRGRTHLDPYRLAYFLAHEYTERGLTWDRLKGQDAVVAGLLGDAAQRAGPFPVKSAERGKLRRRRKQQTEPDWRTTVLRIRGDVDVATAEQFRRAVLSTVRRSARIVFDVEGAMFLDASGTRAATRRRPPERG